MKKALGLGYRSGYRTDRRESKIENLAPPVGLEPMTSCILGKHTTTVPRGRLQVVYR